MDTLEMSAEFKVSPARLYKAWIDGEAHSAFTGASASVEARVGGEYTAWDGYIQGVTLELEPNRRIVQSWRTTEFPEDSPDSRLEVILEAVKGGARITLHHTDIPDGQAEMYREGWEDYYFKPMRAYFEGEAA